MQVTLRNRDHYILKLVFTREEVAAALGRSFAEFDSLLPSLEGRGFPDPVPGLGQFWSIMDVIQWVNRSPTPAAAPTLPSGGKSRH